MLNSLGIERAGIVMCENQRKRLFDIWLSPREKEWHNSSGKAMLSLSGMWQTVSALNPEITHISEEKQKIQPT